ncbi:hypothetical protein ABVT39_013629, partial [Epinephelus coioides]
AAQKSEASIVGVQREERPSAQDGYCSYWTSLGRCWTFAETQQKVEKLVQSRQRVLSELPAETHTNFPTSGPLEDGASRRERNFGGGEKSIFAGGKCIEFGKFGGHLHEPKRDS